MLLSPCLPLASDNFFISVAYIKHLMPIGQAVIEILSADAVLSNMPLEVKPENTM